jgi:hypothetical protein
MTAKTFGDKPYAAIYLKAPILAVPRKQRLFTIMADAGRAVMLEHDRIGRTHKGA